MFDAYYLRLHGLSRVVIAGTTVDLTYRLRRAGQVTVGAYVQPSNVPRAEPSARCGC